ncbi:NAD(P)/FAD-dependent oxidoreductase [Aspergillus stella-maris]|uniref:NAD(P)/FAD-dependent oxidoreductase n=1 Tax=Aspergillus stella-maris TaxID=1810926 RepID=UPI003CCDB1C0
MTTDMNARIVIIGAGLFGLCMARQLAVEGYKSITVLDRDMPPVPTGSSTDISRVIRFDYADADYCAIAHDAYRAWQEPKYTETGIFKSASYILSGNTSAHGQAWIKSTTAALDARSLPWEKLESAEEAKRRFPVLTGDLAPEPFNGYLNLQAGWADSGRAIALLRDECLDLGVKFVVGEEGTVVHLDKDSSNRKIESVKTLAGTTIEGDHFVLATGAWISSLLPMYNSTMATAQVLGYMRLTPEEVKKYQDLPIYYNASTGWFNFPAHPETQTLKVAIHGWGYTRSLTSHERQVMNLPSPSNKGGDLSAPPLTAYEERKNFTPKEGEARLKKGILEILPELADRPFERTSVCWYTDTPSGDFIIDFHPDYEHGNVFVAGSGSGHAFKFLPVLGPYIAQAWKKTLPSHLAKKWRFRTEYADREDAFWGDGSRGGPGRREFDREEKAKL